MIREKNWKESDNLKGCIGYHVAMKVVDPMVMTFSHFRMFKTLGKGVNTVTTKGEIANKLCLYSLREVIRGGLLGYLNGQKKLRDIAEPRYLS